MRGLQALSIMHKELDTTMALCGHWDIREVTQAILVGGSDDRQV